MYMIICALFVIQGLYEGKTHDAARFVCLNQAGFRRSAWTHIKEYNYALVRRQMVVTSGKNRHGTIQASEIGAQAAPKASKTDGGEITRNLNSSFPFIVKICGSGSQLEFSLKRIGSNPGYLYRTRY